MTETDGTGKDIETGIEIDIGRDTSGIEMRRGIEIGEQIGTDTGIQIGKGNVIEVTTETRTQRGIKGVEIDTRRTVGDQERTLDENQEAITVQRKLVDPMIGMTVGT